MRFAKMLVAGLVLAVTSTQVVAVPLSKGRFAATKNLASRTVDQLARVEGGLVGYSVVVSADGHPDFIKTYGVANAESGIPVTPATAFYNASMTKAYTGLLVAKFDRDGTLPLSTTLEQIWPSIRLPAPFDPSQVTLAQLVSHSVGFRNDPLEERTAYTDQVPEAAYPRLLEFGSTPTGKPFHYQNLGYLIYGEALRMRTGRDWKAELQERVFRPFKLTESYTRSSLVPAANLAWGHRWSGSKWLPVKPKDDSVMHAAGGMFVSSRDMAKWMRIQLADGGEAGGFTAQDFATTRHRLSDQDADYYGIRCDGYSIGWHLCSFMGEPIYYHGGTYEGVRTHMILLPRERTGVALAANSDSGTGDLGMEFLATLISSLQGKSVDASNRARAMVARYSATVPKLMELREARVAKSEADPAWNSWKWSPAPEELRRYQGVYHNDLWGDAEVRVEDAGLVVSMGVRRHLLRPASPNLFATRPDVLEAYSPVRFTEAGAGLSVEIGGQTYRRIRVTEE